MLDFSSLVEIKKVVRRKPNQDKELQNALLC